MRSLIFSLRQIDRYTYIECLRLAILGGHINIFEWIYDNVKDVIKDVITPSIVDYFIKEVEQRRYSKDRKYVIDFLEKFKRDYVYNGIE